MSVQTSAFRGQPVVRLALPAGDSCMVALHGAHVLSWMTADGVERLFLSPDARFDGQSAIRGGVEREIKPGDLVFIPPGVPHGIKQSKSITYLNIRFEAREAKE